MKKATLFATILCIVFAFGIARAALKDSTMLANPEVLGTDIQKGSAGGVPVGTVITWPSMSNPTDPETRPSAT